MIDCDNNELSEMLLNSKYGNWNIIKENKNIATDN